MLPSSCNSSAGPYGNFSTSSPDVVYLKTLFYSWLTPLVALFGIAGNVLNLLALRSPALQTIPFMYIRAVAVLDLVGLTLIVGACLRITDLLPHFYWLAIYQSHIEIVLVNTCLTASLYCAVALTVERFRLICRPFKNAFAGGGGGGGQTSGAPTSRCFDASSPQQVAASRMTIVGLLAFILHIPMGLQFAARTNSDGEWVSDKNRALLCVPSWLAFFSWHSRVRESIRLAGVLLMVVLNVVIARQLQATKRRRRRLTTRSLSIPEGSSASVGSGRSAVLNGFAEKKLTALMAAITLIYCIGNIPQAILMVSHAEAEESSFTYQLFRAIANLMEVLNHCLNFYVFCMACREYRRAFLQNCRFCHKLLPARLCASLSMSPSTAAVTAQQQQRTLVAVVEEQQDADDDESSGRLQMLSPSYSAVKSPTTAMTTAATTPVVIAVKSSVGDATMTPIVLHHQANGDDVVRQTTVTSLRQRDDDDKRRTPHCTKTSMVVTAETALFRPTLPLLARAAGADDCITVVTATSPSETSTLLTNVVSAGGDRSAGVTSSSPIATPDEHDLVFL